MDFPRIRSTFGVTPYNPDRDTEEKRRMIAEHYKDQTSTQPLPDELQPYNVPFPPGQFAQEEFDDMLQRRVVDPLAKAGFEDLGAGLAAVPSAAHSMIVPQTEFDVAATLIPLPAVAKLMKKGKFRKISKAMHVEDPENAAKIIAEQAGKAEPVELPTGGSYRDVTKETLEQESNLLKKDPLKYHNQKEKEYIEAARKLIDPTSEPIQNGKKVGGPRHPAHEGYRPLPGKEEQFKALLKKAEEHGQEWTKLKEFAQAMKTKNPIGKQTKQQRLEEEEALRKAEKERWGKILKDEEELDAAKNQQAIDEALKRIQDRKNKPKIVEPPAPKPKTPLKVVELPIGSSLTKGGWYDQFDSRQEFEKSLDQFKKLNRDNLDLNEAIEKYVEAKDNLAKNPLKPRSGSPEDRYLNDQYDKLIYVIDKDRQRIKFPKGSKNIKGSELDELYFKLNRLSRDDPEFVKIQDRIDDITGNKPRPERVDPPKGPKGDPEASLPRQPDKFAAIRSQLDVAPSRMDERGKAFGDVGQSEFLPDSRPNVIREDVPKRNYVEAQMDPVEQTITKILADPKLQNASPEQKQALANFVRYRYERNKGITNEYGFEKMLGLKEDQRSITGLSGPESKIADYDMLRKMHANEALDSQLDEYSSGWKAYNDLDKYFGRDQAIMSKRHPAVKRMMDALSEDQPFGRSDTVFDQSKDLQDKMYKGRPSHEAEQAKLFPKVKEAVKGKAVPKLFSKFDGTIVDENGKVVFTREEAERLLYEKSKDF
jgi:hypothetical protein